MALVQRNFQLPSEQAEWLRQAAAARDVKQADLVRWALEAARADLEGRVRPRAPGAPRRALGALGGAFADGVDSAALLLADRRAEERRDVAREARG